MTGVQTCALPISAYREIGPVVAVEKKVRRRRADVVAAVALGIGNGRVESINNKIKVTVRMGYGFRNTDNLVALIMLRCSDGQPALPWEDRGEERRKVARDNQATSRPRELPKARFFSGAWQRFYSSNSYG